jgi:hypothetical protein
MTYFPPKDTSPPTPEKCRACHRWFVPKPGWEMVSCCVMHPPGSCCHYSETEVPEPPRRSVAEGFRRKFGRLLGVRP